MGPLNSKGNRYTLNYFHKARDIIISCNFVDVIFWEKKNISSLLWGPCMISGEPTRRYLRVNKALPLIIHII